MSLHCAKCSGGGLRQARVVQRRASRYQTTKGFLKRATCISKPDKQDLIDFVSNSLAIVHLLKSSKRYGQEWDFSTLTFLTWGLDNSLFQGACYLGHYRLFISIFGLYPLDASRPLAPSCNKTQKYPQSLTAVPCRANLAPVKNHRHSHGSPRPGLILLRISRYKRMKLFSQTAGLMFHWSLNNGKQAEKAAGRC